MFFRRKSKSLFVEHFKRLVNEIEKFIPLDKIESVTQYVVGPINMENYFELKFFLLKNKPLTTFEIYGNDFLTIYKVKSNFNIDLIFARRNSEDYKRSLGFYSLIKESTSDDYLNALNYFVLYKDRVVYTSSKNLVGKEFVPASSEALNL